jgi:hypothetical protein
VLKWNSEEQRGASPGRAKEIAARTVNKSGPMFRT